MASRNRRTGSSGRPNPKGGAFDSEKPVAIGRRPSSVGFLTLVAIMWMAVGVILFQTLSTGWRLIPAVFAFGVGLMFLRGAMSTLLRRDRRRTPRD